MTSPEAIEVAFAALADQVTGVEYAESYEPERLQATPAVTCVYLGYDVAPEAERELGPQLEVRWEWRVHLYVTLADGQWKQAQHAYRDLVSRLVTLPKHDRTLGDVCEAWELNDPRHEPDFGEHRPGMLLKELELIAWTYEVAAP
jgi:hypothetical protein